MNTEDRTTTEMRDAIARYLAGALGSNELKPFLAPSGIYEQRNAKFMLRVRVTGGHLEASSLRALADVMDRRAIPYGHLSSRQCIQLHDVVVEAILDTIHECQDIGLPFKGGGGNTYRNILSSPDSGFAPDEVFDVLPYARAINRALASHPEALLLPRKFKLGLFAKPSEEFLASVQDLGFVATMSGGRRGFTVYGGGGMGRDSGVGVRLFDFLPDDQLLRCVLAMIRLFGDQGDRSNRHQARLRYVLKRRGAADFARLFLFYYETTVGDAPMLSPGPVTKAAGKRPVAVPSAPLAFESWKAHAVGPTKFGADQVTVRLYVPYGNVNTRHCRQLAALAEEFGGGFLRLMRSQDLLLAPVRRDSLPELFNRLITEFPDLDLTLRSFRGHITTCVGSSVCKIGILSAPALADAIADRMNSLLPADTPGKLKALRRITDDVLVSGCPNSCSGHPVAWLGFQGAKQRIGDKVVDVVLPFKGKSTQRDSLGLSTCGDATTAIPVDTLPSFVVERIQGDS